MAFQDAPIQRKLMTMTLATSGVVLLLTCAAFFGYEAFTFRRAAVRQLATLGEVIAANSTGALAFDNADDATQVLAALKAERHIVAACLYDAQGKLFSRYPASVAAGEFPGALRADGFRFEDGYLIGFAPVVQVKGSQRLGTLYLRSDMDALYERLRLYAGIAVLVVAVAFLVAYVLSRTLQQQISRPVLALAETARAVSDRHDYAVRAAKHGADEFGLLTDAFNHMLAQIEAQNAELEKRVRERTAELEAANDELEAFCSSAAHDLRTPIRAITGFTDILLSRHTDALPADVRHHISQIRDGSSQMSQLITDLLAFSRLGRQAIAREMVDPETLSREVLKELESERKDRRVEVRIAALPPLHGDPALLRVVFVNLISNALKYSRPRDPAVIEIGVTTQPGEASPVFFVRDNGVGFDMQNAEKLFGLFKRLHHAHEFEGTGVGLATVRRIIERHGGRIWAEAAPGTGATFFFTVPAESELTN
jgi:signal transduction histidine kinase